MVDIIKAMLAHYSSPDKWIRGSFFECDSINIEDDNFNWDELSGKEYSCCLVGNLLSRSFDVDINHKVLNLLDRVLRRKYNSKISVVTFNDNHNTTFEDVIEVLKEAIVIAEKENVP